MRKNRGKKMEERGKKSMQEVGQIRKEEGRTGKMMGGDRGGKTELGGGMNRRKEGSMRR